MITYDLESMSISGVPPVLKCEVPGVDEHDRQFAMLIYAADKARARKIAAELIQSYEASCETLERQTVDSN